MRAALVLVIGSVACACGETSSENGAGSFESDSGADVAADVEVASDAPSCVIPPQNEYLKPNRVVGVCPQPGPSCLESPLHGAPLLSAAEVDLEASFVAVSGDLVLAERPRANGTMEPLVVLLSSFDDDPFSILELPELAPDARGVSLDRHTLLTCAGDGCRVDPVDPLAELSGAVPADIGEPAGVVEWLTRKQVCVYGNGLHCYDGATWHALVPADSGPRLLAAAVTQTSIWAAGEAGRVVIASPDCWRELESGTEATLRSLSADSSRELWAVASGDSGAVSYLSLDETIACTVGALTTRVLRDWGETSGAATADGQDDQWVFQVGGTMIQGKPSIGGNWCVGQLADTVIDETRFTCGIADNQRVITATALFGTRFCALD